MRIDIERGLSRPKIDVHTHVWAMETEVDVLASADHLVASGGMLGITEYWASSPITGGRMASIEEVRRQNDAVLKAMERHPAKIRGMCFVIPGHGVHALKEIERCLERGMVGIKLYNQHKISDPIVGPVLELAIERAVPVLVHAAYLTSPEDRAKQPLTSHANDFVDASERYPEAMLIHAHIGGGGDWEWALRALTHASPNVYIDVSGSNLDDGQVEYAVELLGARRVLFGTDGTMEGSVGKVLDADLTDAERERIFWTNAAEVLAKQGLAPTVPAPEASRGGYAS